MMPIGDSLKCFKANSTALGRIGRCAKAQLKPHLVPLEKFNLNLSVGNSRTVCTYS